MNYNTLIEQSIDFIERNLTENITAQQVAEHAGYSVFHFCRVFAMLQGITLGDYIRQRRLSLARVQLLKGKKIIDIALEFGFETPSGFSKAFRKEFGYSPTFYLSRMNCWDISQNLIRLGDIIMNPVIKKMPAFNVAGYGIETNIFSSFMKDIAAYWETYDGEDFETKMYEQLTPPKHGEVGLCIASPSNGNATYLLGVMVEDFSKVTSDMISVTVPAAEYAVFTTPPVDLTSERSYETDLSQVVKSTWKYIFEEWFPNSNYIYDESKLDFEFYDERCHSRSDSVMDIYIPVLQNHQKNI